MGSQLINSFVIIVPIDMEAVIYFLAGQFLLAAFCWAFIIFRK